MEAKVRYINDPKTKEPILPITSPKAVIDEEGTSQETLNEKFKESSQNTSEALQQEVARAKSVEQTLEGRVATVEGLAEIYIDGGEAQIATPTDIVNPTTENRAKIPSVGAIVDSGLNILDISALYPTSGVDSGSLYTLALAIAAVPTAYHRGGIQIKFIDSATQKYVHYFLTSNTWSIDVNDWQGVDDVPIAGSQNLVTSGGVQNELLGAVYDISAHNDNAVFESLQALLSSFY